MEVITPNIASLTPQLFLILRQCQVSSNRFSGLVHLPNPLQEKGRARHPYRHCLLELILGNEIEINSLCTNKPFRGGFSRAFNKKGQRKIKRQFFLSRD